MHDEARRSLPSIARSSDGVAGGVAPPVAMPTTANAERRAVARASPCARRHGRHAPSGDDQRHGEPADASRPSIGADASRPSRPRGASADTARRARRAARAGPGRSRRARRRRRRRAAGVRSSAASTASGGASNRSRCGSAFARRALERGELLLGRADHALRHAGEPRDLQAVAAARRARPRPRAGTRCRARARPPTDARSRPPGTRRPAASARSSGSRRTSSRGCARSAGARSPTPARGRRRSTCRARSRPSARGSPASPRCRIAAASVISTMNVERPPARSSAAPMRVKIASIGPITARAAGTKLPQYASSTISAVWRMNVDLPPMFGPVTTSMRRSGPRRLSFAMKRSAPPRRCARDTAPRRPDGDRRRSRCPAPATSSGRTQSHARGAVGERREHVDGRERARDALQSRDRRGERVEQRVVQHASRAPARARAPTAPCPRTPSAPA